MKTAATPPTLASIIENLLPLSPDEFEQLSRLIATDLSEGTAIRDLALRVIRLAQQESTPKPHPTVPQVVDLLCWRQSHPRQIKR
jgi:hypothetical protein